MGSYGSRSLASGGSAISKAVDKIINKAKKLPPIFLKRPKMTLTSRMANLLLEEQIKKKRLEKLH